MTPEKKVEEWAVYEVISGSRSYGFNTPNSDWDYTGVFIPPVSYFMGLDIADKAYQNITDEKDVCYYEIRKFFKLAIKSNPNILETLFAKKENITKIHDCFYAILDKKKEFLSKGIIGPYLGYANSQFEKIKTVRHKVIAHVDENGKCNDSISNSLKIYLEGKMSSKRFNMDVLYDTKHASHLIRLLQQCKFILENNDLSVEVEDGELFKDIRSGNVPFNCLYLMQKNLIDEIRVLEKESKIKESIDYEIVNRMCVNAVRHYLGYIKF